MPAGNAQVESRWANEMRGPASRVFIIAFAPGIQHVVDDHAMVQWLMIATPPIRLRKRAPPNGVRMDKRINHQAEERGRSHEDSVTKGVGPTYKQVMQR